VKRCEFDLLWPFYLTALLSASLSVAIPIWVIFFQSRFTFLQISLALSLQAIAAILFEIPSGSVADTLGRKNSVVVGILLQGLLWLLLPFIRHDMLLYAVFFSLGLARTLESGADSAWMVDWLRENRQGVLGDVPETARPTFDRDGHRLVDGDVPAVLVRSMGSLFDPGMRLHHREPYPPPVWEGKRLQEEIFVTCRSVQ
jgi:hypothetical protein